MSFILCLLVPLFVLLSFLPVCYTSVLLCTLLFGLFLTHENEPFMDTIISTTSTNASCAAYCAYNKNNEVTNNDPQAHSAVCIGTPLASHSCSASNVSALNCFCAVSDNNSGTWTLPTSFSPITGIANVSLCQKRCDTLGVQCQGYTYNRSTQTCTLRAQLLLDTQTSAVNASSYLVSINMYYISPGPSIIPALWYTFNDYTPLSALINNYGTLGISCNGTLATGLTGGTKATVTLSPITYNNNIVLTNCLSLSLAQKQYMSIPSFTFGGGDFTVCFWYNTSGTGGYARVFDFGNGAPAQNLLLDFQTSTLKLYMNNGTTTIPQINHTSLMTAGTSADGSWRHLALVCTYGTATSCTYTCYANGTSSGISFTGPALLQTSRTKNYIGRSNWSADPYIDMSMNDFRLYSSALTPSQINSIMYSIFLPSVPSTVAPLTFTHKNSSTYTNEVFTLPATSPSYSYCYCNYGMSLLNKIVSFDVLTQQLGDFFFYSSSTGLGQMLRIETRSSFSGGILASASWTSWSNPATTATYPKFTSNRWYHFDIVFTAVPGATDIQLALYVDSALWYSGYKVLNKGNYIGFHGDGGTANTTTYFKNFSIQ